ncbi:branched chain amino acid ABC transporter substrate-binding protein [Chitiniphilus shinanonensis]|uniref:Branched chain amino acid ABC transporter substrate-binding protein n=1 Tax=Chitiniphilus shinanonensis TaxID=553088 RepID=A0ABQ6BW20_9NEIS|nr:branched-chain amino acid ABC transporter substrate-binding protein [Chitiniphilus shinanonensis]GLS05375.1 branched chain amino acid ABC transporter substrate-binding protein [Chitiniphilus shinanonensis]
MKTKSLGVALLAFLALAGCGRQAEKAADNASGVAEIKIGFAAPLTGNQAHYGKGYQNGVQMAIDDVNAGHPTLGGKPVKFVLYAEDDQADPKSATQIAQKFVDMKIAGMIGHFNSGTSIPASKIYADAGIPQIAMATAPDYTQQGYKTTFRSMTSDTQQGSVMGRFAVDKLNARRIAVIDDRTAYGKGLADEFEKAAVAAGATIVRREFTTDRETDFSSILTSIKATQPQLIFYGGTDAQSGPMARQKARLGMAIPLMSGEMTRSDTFLKLAGGEAEGTIASLAGLPLEQMPGGEDFAERYRAKYGELEIYTPYGYDATRVLLQAMKQADSADPVRYLPKLAQIHYAGVTSTDIAYDAKGDLKDGAITVYRVSGGQWRVLETLGGGTK